MRGVLGFAVALALACGGGSMGRVDALVAARTGGIDRGTLMIASERLSDGELRGILADPRVGPLTDLSLHNNALTADAARAIASSEKTSALRNLNLSHNPLGDAGIEVLAAAPAIASLRALSLAAVGATPAGARALAASPHARGIQELDLGFQPIGTAAPALATKRAKLSLQQAGIDGPAAVALITDAQVHTLKLPENPVGSLAGLDRVGRGVISLDLGSCGLTRLDGLATAAAPGLLSLDLDYNRFGDDGLRALAGAPWLAQLQFLSAMGAEGTPAGRDALRAAWGERPGLTIER